MYKKTVLPNQLRVITHDMKERDSITLGIWIGAGGRYENDKNKGAAHFLEHILFKGSKKYSCRQIKELIEGVGGKLNAFTDEEYTCYYARTPAQHINGTFNVLSDMVLFPNITRKDTNKERTVILEEIKMYRDLSQYFVLELLEELMWPDHPLGKNLAGTVKSIGNMSHKDLRLFHQDNYIPGNIVVAASGNLKHQALVNLVKSKFSKIKDSSRPDFVRVNNLQNKTKVRFFRRDIEQMHLALGAFGLEYDHKDTHIINLLNVILGGNMSSRLFDEVREKRGLAYAISSGVKPLKDTGLFLVRAGVDNKKIVIAVGVILKELKKISTIAVSKKELNQAKDYYLGHILLGLEDTLEHMLWLGESTISLNKTRTLNDIIRKVKKIKIADIKRVAYRIFGRGNLNLSIVGPLNDVQERGIQKLIGAGK